MPKRPAFQFYPSDHRGETGLQLSSLAARGLWMEMLCIMHEGQPYGHLTTATGAAIGSAQLARMVGESTAVVTRLTCELEAAGVFARNEDGTIFSRRMVRDERVRNARGAGGRKSLENPNVPRPKRAKDTHKDGVKDAPKDTFGPSLGGSPSSSSSSSVLPPLSPFEGEPPTKAVRRGTTLPLDWQPNDQHAGKAAEIGVDLDAEAEAFRDFHTAKGSVFKDWDAAFRTWLRNALRFGGGSSTGKGDRPSPALPPEAFAGFARMDE